jgi:hypothetical protein
LQKTYTYRFSAKDSCVIVTDYYTNGSVYKKAIYKEVKSISLLQEGGYNGHNLEDELMVDMRTRLADTVRVYFYNKKMYSQMVADRKLSSPTKPYYSSIELYDSTGKKTLNKVYKTKEKGYKNTEWQEFYSNGRLKTQMEMPIDSFAFVRTTMYDASTGEVVDLEMKCENWYAPKAYILTAADNMFSQRNMDKYSPSSFYSYRNRIISTPFFSILSDSAGRPMWQYLAPLKAQWSQKACPPSLPFVVEGQMESIAPKGLWRIFAPDTLGNKKQLLMEMFFKNGLLDGNADIFDINGKKIGHVVYADGQVISTDNAAELEPVKSVETPKLETSEKTIPYLLNAQKAIQKRNPIAVQHRAYKAQKTMVWQRDTVLWLNDFVPTAPFIFTKKKIIPLVLTQFTPDENSLMHFFYTEAIDSTKNETTSIFYRKKTGLMDSISTIISGKDTIYAYNANKKIVYKKRYNSDISQIEYPSDSVIIYHYYTKADNNSHRVTIDSMYYGQDYKAKKYQYAQVFETTLDFYSKRLKNLHKTPNIINSYLTTDKKIELSKYDDKNPYFIKQPDPYPYSVFSTTKKYIPNAKSLYCFAPTDYTDLMTNKKFDMAQENRLEGVYTIENHGRIHINRYKNNQLDGWQREMSKYDDGKRDSLYHNSILVETIKWDARDTTKYSRQVIDSVTHQVKTYTNKNTDAVITMSYFYNNLPNVDFWKTHSDTTTVVVEETFLLNSDGGKTMLNQVRAAKNDVFYINGWYVSGKKRFFAKANGNPYADRKVYKGTAHNYTEPKAEDYNKAEIYYNKEEEDYYTKTATSIVLYLSYWENGKLQTQSAINSAFICEYDSTGVIVKEQLPTDKEGGILYEYPDASVKENCMIEHLPYQIGKMANGHRVGVWQGFRRDNTKTLVYRIAYNSAGEIEGLVEAMNEPKNMAYKMNFENGAYNGLYQIYEKGILHYEKQYVANSLVMEKEYDTNGKLLQWNDLRGKTYKKTHYYKNTNIPQEIITNSADSTFDAAGRLIKARTEIGIYGITTERNSNGRYEKTTIIKGSGECFDTQAEYIWAYTDTITTSPDYIYIDKNSPLKLPKLIDKQAQKKLSDFFKTWKSVEFAADIAQRGWSYYEGNTINNNLYTRSFFLQDKEGNKMFFSSLRNFSVTTQQYKAEKNDYFKPKLLDEPLYTLKGCVPDIAHSSTGYGDKIEVSGDFTSAFLYPRALLRPLHSTNDDARIFIKGKTLTLAKLPVNYNFPAVDMLYLQTTKDRKTVYKTLKNQKPAEDEILLCHHTAFATQKYEIAQTGIYFIPITMTAANTVFCENTESINYNINPTIQISAQYPHHALLDKDGKPTNDDFLSKKAIRLTINSGYLYLPILPDVDIKIQNLLLDKTEINGSFDLPSNDADTEKITAFFASKQIKLIIKKNATGKQEDRYYFQYKL